ncbi:copper-transporting ATPase-like protein [Hapsidospora chrysogenum ATCC 11550]|uniref:Copper-transporting ATPase-like protein n=1 Tax=Hapsidospora chrysogenum (strain ATCC 11550 / CBS 779.69 / DSM 880 / IAM 14645 / JCM 23072 / IMI 49137) TaxID=857340 RepID=A0A086SWA7_HAPC1|nr:copper-transporting ATPase-like protein [Hapsidospora chrysogenum ATCC 11550]
MVATTSFLLGNLHCPSCVAVIKSELHDTYGDHVLWVSPNLVTSVVTVEHDDTKFATVGSIKKTIEDVGYEVFSIDTTATVANDIPHLTGQEPDAAQQKGTSSQGVSYPSSWSQLWLERTPAPDLEAARAAHLEHCEACRSSTFKPEPVHEGRPRLTTSTHPLQSVVYTHGDATLFRATLSIAGMTCAVCVNTITQEVQKLPWVSKVVVNLVSNSATVDFTDSDHAKDIVPAIEDLGYDATLEKVVNLSETEKPSEWREVQVNIRGMFCSRCPERLAKSLSLLGSERLEILETPSLKQPLLKLRYKPNAPNFTIRDILKAVSATDPSLEPSIHHPPTLEEKSRAIRARHMRALWAREILTFVIAIPTFVLGIVYMVLVPKSNPTRHYLMMPWRSGVSRIDIILCLLATPVWLCAADVFHTRTLKEVRAMWRPGSRVPIATRFFKFGSMDMLMSLGTTVAYVSSVAQMIAVAVTTREKIPEGLIYFDSVVFLTLFILAGRLIEAYSKSKAGNAVEMLVKLRPDTAILVEDDSAQGQMTRTIPLDQLENGDIIRVPNGASPPADGVIIAGQANFDESSLTGESRLVKKDVGDDVFAGTVNQSSSLTVRVTSTGGKSMLDQIVDVVREGQTKRAPMERIADVVTSYFVPAITLIAIVTWIVWMALGLSGAVTDKDFDSASDWVAYALRFAIAVFVVACPCGIGLAAPTAIFVGGGLAAKYGILAKGGGEAFEKAYKIDCVVFDKTGTLTTGGDPKITDSIVFPEGPAADIDEQVFWSALKKLEENSSHPIAKAIVSFCGSKSVAVEVESVDELPGKGMKATCRHNTHQPFDIAVGNEALMRDLSAHMPLDVTSKLEIWKAEAQSLAIAAVRLRDTEKWIIGAVMAIADPIREETCAVIAALQDRDLQVWMLSGDNATTAQAVAQRVGIHPGNVLAEVLPSEKADKIKYLQSTLPGRTGRGRRAMVAMVGDGINDSPALTAADVGIAVGSGSDVAISSADFVLATSNLAAVLTLLELSRTVFRRIKFNFGWAVVYNVAAIPFAAGCFYALKTSGGHRITLPPEFAALAMALSSISVVLSSLCLRTRLPLVGFRGGLHSGGR